jgi:Domain of unknown function (DUF4293)
MIQRIQSVYLFVGASLLASNFLLGHVWTGPAAEVSAWFTPLTLGFYSIAIAGGLFAILLYNNRERQMAVILAVVVAAAAGAVSSCVGLYLGGVLPGAESVDFSSIQPLTAVLTPVLSILMFSLAFRSVQKDVKLLKSVDRLR